MLLALTPAGRDGASWIRRGHGQPRCSQLGHLGKSRTRPGRRFWSFRRKQHDNNASLIQRSACPSHHQHRHQLPQLLSFIYICPAIHSICVALSQQGIPLTAAPLIAVRSQRFTAHTAILALHPAIRFAATMTTTTIHIEFPHLPECGISMESLKTQTRRTLSAELAKNEAFKADHEALQNEPQWRRASTPFQMMSAVRTLSDPVSLVQS
ncbi:hypothetical protein MPH_13000 [Macrophomina phaseolina MS6]|uniref:Uncharacterized protein n=1 Tax=Macrophomina phaseolina (strain MS6) TaxID=1126212 RepID=K2R6Q7_MACPH|nr:hypothetical protein MPH_13000 [Macrophomina phaseolina MS6]